jgi:hypothetical protein
MPWRFNQQQKAAGLQASGQCLHGSRGRNGFVDHVKREHEIEGSFQIREPEIFLRGLAQLGLAGVARLACVTLGNVGRTLVHHPSALDLDQLLDALADMLRGLFAG